MTGFGLGLGGLGFGTGLDKKRFEIVNGNQELFMRSLMYFIFNTLAETSFCRNYLLQCLDETCSHIKSSILANISFEK